MLPVVFLRGVVGVRGVVIVALSVMCAVGVLLWVVCVFCHESVGVWCASCCNSRVQCSVVSVFC